MADQIFSEEYKPKNETAARVPEDEEEDIGELLIEGLKQYGTGKPTIEILRLKPAND